MSILEKIKQQLANLDVNSAIATIVTTLGSLNTTDIVQFIYTSLSIFSAVWTIRVSANKNKLDNEYRSVEVELKRAELTERRLQIKQKEREHGEECK